MTPLNLLIAAGESQTLELKSPPLRKTAPAERCARLPMVMAGR